MSSFSQKILHIHRFFSGIFFKIIEKSRIFLRRIFFKLKIAMGAMFEAAHADNSELQERKRVDINSTNKEGNTPVIGVKLNSNLEIIERLIEACKLKKYDMVSSLLEEADLNIRSCAWETVLHVVLKNMMEPKSGEFVNKILTGGGTGT